MVALKRCLSDRSWKRGVCCDDAVLRAALGETARDDVVEVVVDEVVDCCDGRRDEMLVVLDVAIVGDAMNVMLIVLVVWFVGDVVWLID